MKFKVLRGNEAIDKIDGSHFIDIVKTTYVKLLKTLGEPSEYESDKTNVEWDIEFEDGTVATIYDWKTHSIPKELYNWHIGGFNEDAAKRVKEII